MEQKAATRARVRAAALRCFVERGFDATSIADIAGAAGVAHGTFYVHFASKDAVADDLLREFNDDFAARLARSLDRASVAAAERVRAAAELFIDHWSAHRSVIRLHAERAASGLTMERLRDGMNPPMVRLLTRLLVAVGADRGVALPNVELVTHAVLAMWLRVGLQFLFGEHVDRSTAVSTLVHLTLGGLESVLSAGVER